MYVYRLPSVTVSMERDSINWTKGRGLSKKSNFPDHMSILGSRHTIGCQPCFRTLKTGRETTIPGPFAIKPACPDFTSYGNHQILSQKDPLQAVGLLLWLGARSHWCRRRK